MKTKKILSFGLIVSMLTLLQAGCANRVAYQEEQLPEDLSVVDTNITDSAEGGGVDSLPSEASTDIPMANNEPAPDEPLPVDGLVAQEPTPSATPDSMPTDSVPTEGLSAQVPQEVSPVAAVSESSGAYEYTVRRGDTLMYIAYLCYSDIYQWKKIVDDNRETLTRSGALRVGMRLKVDAPPQEDDFTGYERYLIKMGDTLGIISKEVYGTPKKWRALWKQNERLVKNPNRIYAGFFLRYSLNPEEQRLNQDLKQSNPILGSESQEGSTPRMPSSQVPQESPQQASGADGGTPTF